jgi:hypothetical protein
MYAHVQTHTTTGEKDAILVDQAQSPFNMSASVVVASGTATFGVQYTMDDLNDSSITPFWFDDANIPAGSTASEATNYMFPIRAIRINISAISGSVRFTVLQGIHVP